VYFKDPEGNGVEIFCDSPFHVQQPQVQEWDPQMDIEPLTSWTKETFESENEFGPIEEFYEQQTQNE
jgi:catechol-2,3-dioxygenase